MADKDTEVTMKVASMKDLKNLQADFGQVFQWVIENNVIFNGNNFQLLGYGRMNPKEILDTKYRRTLLNETNI